MIYKNIRPERDKILEKIGDLKSKGYIRRDVINDRVEMSKIISKGKKCKQESVISFTFNHEKKEIEETDTTRYTGIEEVKGLLYGWSSPEIETSNAVKAGLLDANDIAIFEAQFTPREWSSVC